MADYADGGGDGGQPQQHRVRHHGVGRPATAAGRAAGGGCQGLRAHRRGDSGVGGARSGPPAAHHKSSDTKLPGRGTINEPKIYLNERTIVDFEYSRPSISPEPLLWFRWNNRLNLLSTVFYYIFEKNLKSINPRDGVP
jgi:hypothetical protein